MLLASLQPHPSNYTVLAVVHAHLLPVCGPDLQQQEHNAERSLHIQARTNCSLETASLHDQKRLRVGAPTKTLKQVCPRTTEISGLAWLAASNTWVQCIQGKMQWLPQIFRQRCSAAGVNNVAYGMHLSSGIQSMVSMPLVQKGASLFK